MRFITVSLLLFILGPNFLFGQVDFDRFFEDKTMRIDYHHIGNATSESAVLDSIYTYGIWAGTKSNLTAGFDYGQSFYKIIDKQTGKLIYTKGFDNYFNEYQTTDKAIAGETKSFYESAIIPHPKNPFFFILEKRDSVNQLYEIFRAEITPFKDAHQLKLEDITVKVFTVIDNGNPEKKVDIVIIGDGYTKYEIQKFEQDLERATNNFFSIEPLKSNRDKFNVRGVFKPSIDSGVSDPVGGGLKNTAVNSTFGVFGVDRYLLTEDVKSVSDLAAYVPYDAIFIMANSSKYGGGGIYNFYCTFTSDDINSGFLMVHEFGHSFFGLGDEYYSSSTAYNDFYPEGSEPLAPNITANANKEMIKWKSLLTESSEVPTPWEKAKYDSSGAAWQKESKLLNEDIATLKKEKATASEIAAKEEEYSQKNLAHRKSLQDILKTSKYAGKVGAFEGAGYASTGLYRPSVTCIMFTQEDHFCPVCTEAMVKMIDWYTGE